MRSPGKYSGPDHVTPLKQSSIGPQRRDSLTGVEVVGCDGF